MKGPPKSKTVRTYYDIDFYFLHRLSEREAADPSILELIRTRSQVNAAAAVYGDKKKN